MQTYDLADVRGHEPVKRALEVAVASGLNLLMIAPPGAGRTMLARRAAGLLPPMGPAERVTASMLHGFAGLRPDASQLDERPFRAPHHTVSEAAMDGGGPVNRLRPGELSLAHAGILFLDDVTEFRRAVLSRVRYASRHGIVRLSRAREAVTVPAEPALVIGSAQPCPCGYAGSQRRLCACPDTRRERYRARLSALRDLFPLAIRFDALPRETLLNGPQGEPTAVRAARVQRAREILATASYRSVLEDARATAPLAALHRCQRGLASRLDGVPVTPGLRLAIDVTRAVAALDGRVELHNADAEEAVALLS